MPLTANPTAAEQLATITRAFVCGQREALDAALREVALDRRRAAANGTTHELPRLDALLEAPEFAELRRVLAERGVDLEQLQRIIDELLQREAVPAPNSALERRLGPLIAAASSGADVETLLAELRAELLAEQPERASELDAFIDQLRVKLVAFTASAG